MAGSLTLPFGDGVRLIAKSREPGRAIFEFDRDAQKSTDRPRRNAQGQALFRHQAMLQLEQGADVIDVSLNLNREEGLGAFEPISLDPATATITVSSQRDAFDLRITVVGAWQPTAKKAS